MGSHQKTPHYRTGNGSARLTAHGKSDAGTASQTHIMRKGGAAMSGRTPQQAIDLTGDSPGLSRKKRKAGTSYAAAPASSPTKKVRKPKASGPSEEKRRRRWRAAPPLSFDSVYDRALSQRFFVLQRTRCGTDECPEEVVEMTGSTGNIYTVHFAQQPTCNCPHAQNGNQCKHVLYVLSRVLNAPFRLVYQLALVSSELRSIFASAPPIVSPADAASASSKNRKDVSGDCPICFSELEADSPESVVWCRAACGQNIHQQCFEMWARTRGREGSDVTCPFCRSPWEGDKGLVANLVKTKVGREGYVNVASQLGISRARDESTYSSWYDNPRRRRRGWG